MRLLVVISRIECPISGRSLHPSTDKLWHSVNNHSMGTRNDFLAMQNAKRIAILEGMTCFLWRTEIISKTYALIYCLICWLCPHKWFVCSCPRIALSDAIYAIGHHWLTIAHHSSPQFTTDSLFARSSIRSDSPPINQLWPRSTNLNALIHHFLTWSLPFARKRYRNAIETTQTIVGFDLRSSLLIRIKCFVRFVGTVR